MNNTWNKISAIIWQDHLWFPPGVSFTDLTDKPGITYPKPQDLTNLLLYGIVMFLVRLIFDRWMKSAAIHLGVKGRRKVETNNQLENFFSKSSKHPREEDVVILSKQTDLSIRQIQRWFRRRKNYEKPNKQEKFVEASWLLFEHTFSTVVGAAVLLPTSWFWDVQEYWRGYPYLPMSNQMYFYAMLEGAFAVTSVCHIWFDLKRDDAIVVNIHHIATIILIATSYCSNLLRCQTMVVFILKIPHIFLQFGRILLYTKNDSNRILKHGIFAAFTFSFIAFKLFIFPYEYYSMIFHRANYFDGFFVLYLIVFFQLILHLIFILWTVQLCKIIYKLIIFGEVKDHRSDDEESWDQDNI